MEMCFINLLQIIHFKIVILVTSKEDLLWRTSLLHWIINYLHIHSWFGSVHLLYRVMHTEVVWWWKKYFKFRTCRIAVPVWNTCSLYSHCSVSLCMARGSETHRHTHIYNEPKAIITKQLKEHSRPVRYFLWSISSKQQTTHVHAHSYIASTHTHTHTRVHTHTHIHARAHTSVHTRICTHTHICIQTHTHTHTHTHVRTHTHTCTHTH